MEEQKLKKIRVSGTSHRRRDQGEVTIGELTSEEMESMEAFTLGACWIRVSEDGRLERRERFAELPGPIEDPCQPPKWIPLVDWTKEAPFLVNPTPPLAEEPNPKYNSPAFIVKYLCGYNNTPYEHEARKLQSYGFECLRSRRGRDGRFWEIWYLAGYYFAKGELKSEMALKSDDAEQISAAINFLCRRVSFGTLDVCYQRAAMVID
jgi:hypothetical protein